MNLSYPLTALGLVLILGISTGLYAQGVAPVSPQKHLEITGNHKLRIVYDSTFIWPGGSGLSAVMYLPVPPETGGQKIEHFSSTLKGQITTDSAEPPHHLLTATIRPIHGEERRVHWRVEMIGQFQTRQLVDGPPSATAPPIIPPGPGEFLASTESINWQAEGFQDWLDASGLRRKAGESSEALGARIYVFLKAHADYSYPPASAWNAAAVCHHLHTDCGGLSLVFTAACRANKIPARLMVGQWFKAHKQADGSVELTEGRQAHVIAEFFDPQIGWIPEDISSTFLKTPGYPDYDFFGRDPGYFFTWHFDTDFHFNTPRKPDAHVQWIQNPNLWFSENADEANDTVSHHWTIETMQ